MMALGEVQTLVSRLVQAHAPIWWLLIAKQGGLRERARFTMEADRLKERVLAIRRLLSRRWRGRGMRAVQQRRTAAEQVSGPRLVGGRWEPRAWWQRQDERDGAAPQRRREAVS